MKKLITTMIAVGFVTCLVAAPASSAITTVDAISILADHLDADQEKLGFSAGVWPGEPGYSGSIVPGMVCAYLKTSDPAYKTSAELGGDYIIDFAGGNFLGDEAYALTLLSDISADPQNNPWRDALDVFYLAIKNNEGTANYIAGFDITDPSIRVFYLAHLTLAAYYVDADDKVLFREGLIENLTHVHDDADESFNFPVWSLGVATWALVQIGPLDNTLIDPFATGEPDWNGVTLADLPVILAGHQAPDAGNPNLRNSFYWRFDHTDGDPANNNPPAGFTEDTIYGALALIMVAKVTGTHDYDSNIRRARTALLNGVPLDGVVTEHLTLGGADFYHFAGEMLQVMCELTIPGDMDKDGDVELDDFLAFVAQWLRTDCDGDLNSWCECADITMDGTVNYFDFALLQQYWQFGT